MKPKRKKPSLTMKYAAALAYMPMLNRDGTPVLDGMGRLVPMFTIDQLRKWTEHQFVAKFELHHNIYHAWQGPHSYWNYVPMLKAAHRKRTKRDQTIIARAKVKERERQAATPAEMRIFRTAEEVSAAVDKLPKKAKDRRKSQPMPGSKASKWKRKFNGELVAR